jgi:hypothetical protein
MRNFKFVKLSGRWFVDIPWDGDISDLEMVAGANTLLECYQKDGIAVCTVYEDGDTIPFKNKNTIHLTRDFCDDNGAFYKVDSELFRGDIWLCPVLKHIFGEYPEYIDTIFY